MKMATLRPERKAQREGLAIMNKHGIFINPYPPGSKLAFAFFSSVVTHDKFADSMKYMQRLRRHQQTNKYGYQYE